MKAIPNKDFSGNLKVNATNYLIINLKIASLEQSKLYLFQLHINYLSQSLRYKDL